MGKLRPGTSNPDFQASFQFLEELGVSLRNSLSILEGLWESKGTKLDHGLQHKLFEHDSEQLIDWMDQQCRLLSRQLTDIGADSKTASVAMKSVDEYKNSIQVSYSMSHTPQCEPRPLSLSRCHCRMLLV